MGDAAHEHAREPDLAGEMTALAAETRSLHAATRKLHAITRALIARVSAECDRGAVTDDAICALTELQSRYEDGRKASERNSAALEQAAGSLHLARQALARGIAIGEQRAAMRVPRARHARQDGPALRVLGLAVPPVVAGGWAAVRAHAKGAAASAVTAGAMAAGTVVTLHVATQPYASAPHRTTTLAPAATGTVSAAVVTLAPLRRRRHHRAVLPAPSPGRTRARPSPSPSPSASPASSPSSIAPGTLTGSAAAAGSGVWTLTLTAQDGPVAWSLTCSPGLTLSEPSGHLVAGQSETVTVTSASPLSGGTIWLWPGDIPVRVRAPALTRSTTRSTS